MRHNHATQQILICKNTQIHRNTKYVHIKSTIVYAPRRNWDSPQPPTRRLVCPLPPVSGGRGTLAGEKGVGRVPIPDAGHTLWYSLYVRTLCIGRTSHMCPKPAKDEIWPRCRKTLWHTGGCRCVGLQEWIRSSCCRGQPITRARTLVLLIRRKQGVY